MAAFRAAAIEAIATQKGNVGFSKRRRQPRAVGTLGQSIELSK